jgi:hypothetical protein
VGIAVFHVDTNTPSCGCRNRKKLVSMSTLELAAAERESAELLPRGCTVGHGATSRFAATLEWVRQINGLKAPASVSEAPFADA